MLIRVDGGVVGSVRRAPALANSIAEEVARRARAEDERVAYCAREAERL